MKQKDKFNKSIVRPTILYGSEFRVVDKQIVQRMNVADMRILRWMSGMTRENRVWNAYLRGSIKVTLIMDKMKENR